MEVVVEVDAYDRRRGISYEWDPDWNVTASGEPGRIQIAASRDALHGLAAILLTLAQDGVPTGTHVHLDSFAGLRDEAGEILLERL